MSGDDLLTAREAEDFTGIPYGTLDQHRRMVGYVEREHPDEPERLAKWRAVTPPWVKVGRKIMYRRADLLPFVTSRGGVHRNGTCGDCRFYEHGSWEIGTEWFDPNRANCTWGAKVNLPQPAPPWTRRALRSQRVQAKGGRTCDAFEPLIKDPVTS